MGDSTEEIQNNREVDKTFEPQMSEERRNELYAGWKEAVKRSMNWAQE